MTSHTLYRDAAVLLSVVAPADLVRVLAMARAPGATTVSTKAFTWGLPAAVGVLGGLGLFVSADSLGWHVPGASVPPAVSWLPGWCWPGPFGVIAVLLGVVVAFGGEVLVAAAPVIATGRRPGGLSVHRAFAERPAVLAASTSLTAVGEEIIYRGLWVGLLVATFGVPGWAAVAVAALVYAANHWYLGAGVVRQKTWSGVVYGVVYLACGGALIAAVLTHVLHNLVVAAVATANGRGATTPVHSGASR